MRLAAFALAALVPLAGCGAVFPTYRDLDTPIASKAAFDAAAYMGRWYEVARFPVIFERGCVGVTADYALRADGTVSVLNTCRNPDGTVKSTIEGSAQVVGPGRLEVSFPSVPFGASDYWVLWTDESYRVAVVGAPNGRSGWILSREPDLRPDLMAAARDVLAFNGYDLSQLEDVPQP